MNKVFLIDLDGTLYSGKNALPYARQFIDFLNENNYKYLALTNCPSKTQEQVSNKLMSMKIDIKPQNILTSGMAAANVLKEKYKIRSVFILGTTALEKEFRKKGISICKDSAQAVVVGYDTALTYKRLSDATVLVNNGAALFSTNVDNVIPYEGKKIPHTGAIAKAVEFATGKECIYIGKPQPYMLDIACKLLNCDKNDCVMVGDRTDTDVMFAKKCGITSYLVLGENGALKENVEPVPDFVFSNLLEIIKKEMSDKNVYKSI